MPRSGLLSLVASASAACLVLVGLRWALASRSQDRPAGVEPSAPALEEEPLALPRACLQPAELPPGPLRTTQELRAVVARCRAASASEAAELRAALQSADPAVSANALRALARLGLAGGAAELAAHLRDPRPRVRQEAVVVLGKSGDPAAIDELEELLQGEDATLRRLALRALGELGGGRAEALVAAVAGDGSATDTDRALARAALSAGEPQLSLARRPSSRQALPSPEGAR